MKCNHGWRGFSSAQRGIGCPICRLSVARFDVISTLNPDGSVPRPYGEPGLMSPERFPHAFGSTGGTFRGKVPGTMRLPSVESSFDDMGGHRALMERKRIENLRAQAARALAMELAAVRFGG